MKNKILALVLATLMVFTMIPFVAVTASAEGDAKIVPDTSWYDSTKTEFTLNTPAELLGFSVLIQDFVTFAGKTIKLGADIDLNPSYTGGATATNYWFGDNASNFVTTYKQDGTVNQKFEWPRFGGTFDGQGHTVHGVVNIGYIKYGETAKSTGNNGLFGTPAGTTAVKNVTFDDCYVKTGNQSSFLYNYTNGTAWSVTDVTLKNVTLDSTSDTIGLLMGAHNSGNATVSGVFVDADCKVIGKGDKIGGLIGKVGAGSVAFTDTVFLGTVKNNSASGWCNVWTAGFVAYVSGTTKSNMPKVSATGCVFGGTIDVGADVQGTAGMFGECTQSDSITVENSASYGTWIGGKAHTHGLFTSRFGTTTNVEGYAAGAKTVTYTFNNVIGSAKYVSSAITEYQNMFGQINAYYNNNTNTTNMTVEFANVIYGTPRLFSKNVNTGTYKATYTQKAANVTQVTNTAMASLTPAKLSAAGFADWAVPEGSLPIPASLAAKFPTLKVTLDDVYKAPAAPTVLPNRDSAAASGDDGAAIIPASIAGKEFYLETIFDASEDAYTLGKATSKVIQSADGINCAGFTASGDAGNTTVRSAVSVDYAEDAYGLMFRFRIGDNNVTYHVEVGSNGKTYQFSNGKGTTAGHYYWWNGSSWGAVTVGSTGYNADISARSDLYIFIPFSTLVNGTDFMTSHPTGTITSVGAYLRCGDSVAFGSASATVGDTYLVKAIPTGAARFASDAAAVEAGYVAKSGDLYYKYLTNVDAGYEAGSAYATSSSAPVTLIADVSLAAKWMPAGDVTIDGNGKKITVTHDSNAVEPAGGIAITFTLKNLTFERTTAGYFFGEASPKSTVNYLNCTLKNGNFLGLVKGDFTGSTVYNNSSRLFNGAATRTIVGGTFISDTREGAPSNSNFCQSETGNVQTFKGCTFIAYNSPNWGYFVAQGGALVFEDCVMDITETGVRGSDNGSWNALVFPNGDHTGTNALTMKNNVITIKSLGTKQIRILGAQIWKNVVLEGNVWNIDFASLGTINFCLIEGKNGSNISLKNETLISSSTPQYGWVCIGDGSLEAQTLTIDGCTFLTSGNSNEFFKNGSAKGNIDITNTSVLANGKLVFLPETQVNANAASQGKTAFYTMPAVNPVMKDGAAVRLVKDSSGLRFLSDISAADIAKLDGLVTDGTIKSYSFGTLIARADDVLVAPTHSGNYTKLDIPAVNGIIENADGSKTIVAAMTNIHEKNYDVVFAATAYVKYELADGTVGYVYASYDEAKNARDITTVAYRALADVSDTEVTEIGDNGFNYVNAVTEYLVENAGAFEKVTGNKYSPYNEEQRATLAAYLPKAE